VAAGTAGAGTATDGGALVAAGFGAMFVTAAPGDADCGAWAAAGPAKQAAARKPTAKASSFRNTADKLSQVQRI